jgi:hypothetical protein
MNEVNGRDPVLNNATERLSSETPIIPATTVEAKVCPLIPMFFEDPIQIGWILNFLLTEGLCSSHILSQTCLKLNFLLTDRKCDVSMMSC